MTFFHFAASVLPLLTVSGGETLNSLDKTAESENTLFALGKRKSQNDDEADAAGSLDEFVSRFLKGVSILYDR